MNRLRFLVISFRWAFAVGRAPMRRDDFEDYLTDMKTWRDDLEDDGLTKEVIRQRLLAQMHLDLERMRGHR